MEPGRPVVASGAYDNIVLELARFVGKAASEREEEDVAAVVRGSISRCPDEVYIGEGGVITDGDTRSQGGLLTDLFFTVTFCPFSDRVVDPLFIQQLVKLQTSVRKIQTRRITELHRQWCVD